MSLCQLCRLPLAPADAAEMYDPDSPVGSIIVHVRCGERKGLEFERWVCADCHEVTL